MKNAKSPGRKAAIPVTTVDYVVYNATNMATLRAWYQHTFGFGRGGEWHEGWSEFATGPVALCLNTPSEEERKAGILAQNGAVALAVPDIQAAAKACRRRKITILLGPCETSVCWMMFIQDPEGNCLILHQRKNGTAG